MKKLDSNQDKETLQEEVERLRKETKKELKKIDVRKITLTDEQSRLLSSLFPDIDSLL